MPNAAWVNPGELTEVAVIDFDSGASPVFNSSKYCLQVRYLRKKLQQIEALEARVADGAALDTQQAAKVAQRGQVRRPPTPLFLLGKRCSCHHQQAGCGTL